MPFLRRPGVTHTCQGKRCHRCGGFLRVADYARARACFVLSFSPLPPPPDEAKERLARDSAVLWSSRVSLPPLYAPPLPERREGVAIFCLLTGPRRVWCHFLGKRRGRREIWGPSCCHTPGQMTVTMPHPPPSTLFFTPPREEFERTLRKPVYCFWLASLLCSCCLYLLPSFFIVLPKQCLLVCFCD